MDYKDLIYFAIGIFVARWVYREVMVRLMSDKFLYTDGELDAFPVVVCTGISIVSALFWPITLGVIAFQKIMTYKNPVR